MPFWIEAGARPPSRSATAKTNRAMRVKPSRGSTTVSSAEMSSSGKVFRIKFKNAPERGGFIAVYFPNGDLAKRMGDKFGGKDGSGLAGKHVRIHGNVEMYQNQPEIRISDPNQVEVVQ